MRNSTFTILFLLIFLLYWYVSSTHQPVSQPSAPSVTTAPLVLGLQTKTFGCIVHDGLQDKSCTPGAIFPQATKEQICVVGYTKNVRNVPKNIKDQVFAEYGILTHTPGEYEVDHLIALELGGSNDISNLWPEMANPKPGFHEKDMAENYLHEQVCSDAITLQQAQQDISSNWLEVYKHISN